MSFNAICENKILAKISESIVGPDKLNFLVKIEDIFLSIGLNIGFWVL